MWDRISCAELEATKEELRTRRREMIRRDAEELQAIDQDQSEIEAFDQLIGLWLIDLKSAGPVEMSWAAVKPAQKTRILRGVSFLITQRRNRGFTS